MAFDKVSQYAGDHNVVLVGYRGIDGSVRLDCPEVPSALRHTPDLISQEARSGVRRGLPVLRESATRADSDAPAGLTSLHREAPSSTLA
jgi:hypothetical protein